MAGIVTIDVGGTFTDFVAYDPAAGSLKVWKVSTTPHDPGEGIMQGLASANGMLPADHVRLGTTIATNAILERKGAIVAYVTTKGFRDVPFIQRGKRESHYDITWVKPRPFVKRRHCFEVDERITAEGEIRQELNLEEVREIAEAIRGIGHIESVAVCLLFSYVNPDHEQRLAEALQAELPDIPVSISYDVLPKWKEYQRASTTITDAYVKPAVSSYLKKTKARFQDSGLAKSVTVIRSNGGEMSIDAAAAQPIQLTVSGPTGGVVGARHLAGLLEIDNVVTLDMGGTSTDCSTIVGGKEAFTTSYEIEFGIPIQIPMIDIRTIGAGGGSIAWVDSGGMLRVGPQSSGAMPGPACYGRGGSEPTVTDANVVLGRIDPKMFLGGAMALDKAAAEAAVTGLGGKLGMTMEETALAILQIVNNNMVGALRSVLMERGLDPRDFTLLPFGGAGPVHIGDLLREAGIAHGIVPTHPGQFSAFGFMLTDARIDLERTAQMTSRSFDAERAGQILKQLKEDAVRQLAEQGYGEGITLSASVEMRYFAQNHELEVPVPFDDFTPANQETLFDSFHEMHEARFDFKTLGETIEVVTFKLTATAATPHPTLPQVETASGTPSPTSERRVVFDEGAFETPVYWRPDLPSGVAIAGPAIVEEPASVSVVLPGQSLTVNAYGHLAIEDQEG